VTAVRATQELIIFLDYQASCSCMTCSRPGLFARFFHPRSLRFARAPSVQWMHGLAKGISLVTSGNVSVGGRGSEPLTSFRVKDRGCLSLELPVLPEADATRRKVQATRVKSVS
jgi:hypothetical protein